MTEILSDSHFWIGVAFVIFAGILVAAGVPKMLIGKLDESAAKVQAQLDEATRLREEAQALLAEIKTQREAAEAQGREILKTAKEEAKRLEVEAKVRIAEQIQRRGDLAQRRIATAEAAAAAEVKAAAADLAAQIAEQVLASRIAGAKSDPLIDQGVAGLGSKLQ